MPKRIDALSVPSSPVVSKNAMVSFWFGVLLFAEYFFITWQALLLTDHATLYENENIWAHMECVESEVGGKSKGSLRNCLFGERVPCTLRNPCPPCDAATMNLYQTDFMDQFSDENNFRFVKSCRPCTSFGSGENNRECDFVEGVGPYCRFAEIVEYKNYSSYNWVTRPCETCCSEPMYTRSLSDGKLVWEPFDYSVFASSVSIEPSNSTPYVLSLTLEMSLDNVNVSGIDNVDVRIYYMTEDTLSNNEPVIERGNGQWYDDQNKPVISATGQNSSVVVKAASYAFYQGTLYRSNTTTIKTYDVVRCDTDIVSYFMSSSYIDPTWAGGTDTAATISAGVFSHDASTSGMTLKQLLSDANRTLTGAGTHSITVNGDDAQYIAMAYPVQMHFDRIDLSPLVVDRFDVDYLNGRYLQFKRDSCVDTNGNFVDNDWENFTTIQGVQNNGDHGNLTSIVANDTMALSCWRVWSESSFVGLGTFTASVTCVNTTG